MSGTPIQTIIRAFPKQSGWMHGPGEQYFDLTGLPWKDQQGIREELDEQGFYVQAIHLTDPMPIRVALEIRKRHEAEQESKK